jgi:hypothetical protein
MQRRCESDPDSTAHRLSGNNRLILNSKHLVVQVFALTGLEKPTVWQVESSRSIRFSCGTQENTFVPLAEGSAASVSRHRARIASNGEFSTRRLSAILVNDDK